MRAPDNIDDLNAAVDLVQGNKKKAANQLLEEIEHDINDSAEFLKHQVGKINENIDSFKVAVSRINVLQAIAEILGLESKKTTWSAIDDEASQLIGNKTAGQAEEEGLHEKLIDQDILESTEIATIGGTIDVHDKM